MPSATIPIAILRAGGSRALLLFTEMVSLRRATEPLCQPKTTSSFPVNLKENRTYGGVISFESPNGYVELLDRRTAGASRNTTCKFPRFHYTRFSALVIMPQAPTSAHLPHTMVSWSKVTIQDSTIESDTEFLAQQAPRSKFENTLEIQTLTNMQT